LDCGAFTAAFSFSRLKNIQHSTPNIEGKADPPPSLFSAWAWKGGLAALKKYKFLVDAVVLAG